MKKYKINSLLVVSTSCLLFISFGMLQISAIIRLSIDEHIPHHGKQMYHHSSQPLESSERRRKVNKKRKIAYAISVTECKTNSTILDGAAVLSHSIHLASQKSEFYDYVRYAFVEKEDAFECIPQLEAVGWQIIVKDELPVQKEKIQDPSLKSLVDSFGCCGIKEFMKLYAFTLIEYPIAVHLDTDVVILKNLDALFDTMIDNNRSSLPKHHLMHPNNSISREADFYFTRDYLQNSRTTNDPSQYGVQGGFFAVKPNITMYTELTTRLMEKETYDQRLGWSKLGHTGFWGAAQIQGYLSYVYKHHYPNRAVELNRCIYNSMINDNPYHKKTGACLTGETVCEDCRSSDFEDIQTIHLTTCRKPWECPLLKEPTQPPLCKQAHRAWFQTRQLLEKEKWSQAVPTSGWHYEWTYGFCQRPKKINSTSANKPKNKRQYIPMEIPL